MEEKKQAFALLREIKEDAKMAVEEDNGYTAISALKNRHSAIKRFFEEQEVAVIPDSSQTETEEATSQTKVMIFMAEMNRIAQEALVEIDKPDFLQKLIWKLAKRSNKKALKKMQDAMTKIYRAEKEILGE